MKTRPFTDNVISTFQEGGPKIENYFRLRFSPRCMKCRRGLAMRILSICLSVCPSVIRVIPEKMEERSVQIT